MEQKFGGEFDPKKFIEESKKRNEEEMRKAGVLRGGEDFNDLPPIAGGSGEPEFNPEIVGGFNPDRVKIEKGTETIVTEPENRYETIEIERI